MNCDGNVHEFGEPPLTADRRVAPGTSCQCGRLLVTKDGIEDTRESDPLRDILVRTFDAIADREGKPVMQVVEEFFSGYLEGGIHE